MFLFDQNLLSKLTRLNRTKLPIIIDRFKLLAFDLLARFGKSNLRHIKKYGFFAVATISCLCVLLAIYSPTLFQFYIADDFNHLCWVNGILHYPKGLLETYWMSHTDSPFFIVLFFTILFSRMQTMGH